MSFYSFKNISENCLNIVSSSSVSPSVDWNAWRESLSGKSVKEAIDVSDFYLGTIFMGGVDTAEAEAECTLGKKEGHFIVFWGDIVFMVISEIEYFLSG